MRKFSIFILFGLILTSMFSASRAQNEVTRGNKSNKSGGSGESQLVDIKANLVFPHKINDTLTVLCLVGRFAAQHNGAVITADSAVRYSDDRLECFGNVLINKNTTYAYADRAEYDGATNIAALYSPLVKVVDQDVTMYSYNFSFNTLTNVGRYWGRGVSIKSSEESDDEAVMESKRGYYYADTKQVVGVEQVELRGEGYLMKGDSVIYEMEGGMAYFFRNSNIWNENGEYIYGDQGYYDKDAELYSITERGYLLTDEQEVWSDSLEYYRKREEAILRNNIQIDDTTNKSLAFGDYAQYWGSEERILLTRRPTIINYDTQRSDSLFLSGDTILMLSYALGTGPVAEQIASKESAAADLMSELMGDQVVEDVVVEEADSVESVSVEDSTAMVVEQEIERDTIPTRRELRALKRAAKRDARIKADQARTFRKLTERRETLLKRSSLAGRRDAISTLIV